MLAASLSQPAKHMDTDFYLITRNAYNMSDIVDIVAFACLALFIITICAGLFEFREILVVFPLRVWIALFGNMSFGWAMKMGTWQNNRTQCEVKCLAEYNISRRLVGVSTLWDVIQRTLHHRQLDTNKSTRICLLIILVGFVRLGAFHNSYKIKAFNHFRRHGFIFDWIKCG